MRQIQADQVKLDKLEKDFELNKKYIDELKQKHIELC